jgi:hypothetical protein
MKASLSLEFIGASTHDYLKGAERTLEILGMKLDPEDRVRGGPWVAEVQRRSDGGIKLDFLWGKRDYAKANSKGTRGVYVHYVLEQDRLYWVQSPQSWKSTIRYYAAVTPSGEVRRLTDEEAQEWRSAL